MVLGIGGLGESVVRLMGSGEATSLELACIRRDRGGTPGVSTNSDISIGWGRGFAAATPRVAAEKEVDRLRELVSGLDVLVIVAAMNGFAGGAIAPAVARVSWQSGVHTLAVVTKPAEWEGPVQSRLADLNLATLSPHLDGLDILDQERLYDDPLVDEMDHAGFLVHSNAALVDVIETRLRVDPKFTNKVAMRGRSQTTSEEDLEAADEYNRQFRQTRRSSSIAAAAANIEA